MQSSKSQCYIKQIAEQYFCWSFCNLSTKKLILSWFKILHRCVKVCNRWGCYLPHSRQYRERRRGIKWGMENKKSLQLHLQLFCLLIKIYLKQINVSNCQFWIGYILVHILCIFLFLFLCISSFFQNENLKEVFLAVFSFKTYYRII